VWGVCPKDRVSTFATCTSRVGTNNDEVWYNRRGAATALIECTDSVEHKRRRKTWDRGMSSASIKEQFEKRVGQEVDLAIWMGYFA